MESSSIYSFDHFSIWDKVGVYSIENNSSKPKWFQIFAYPAPSGFIHVGTLRSYTYPDVIAKFKRFTGHNVYFPAGIHASGLPAVSFSQKVCSGKYDKYLQSNNATPEMIKQFQTPEGVVEFFQSNYADVWKKMGFFINQETGTPTTIDPGYKKFISWQFRTLAKKGFIVQREYISSYCSKDGPVAIDTAETDLSRGGKAEIIENIDEQGKKSYSFSEPVICRCGEPIQIRYVPDQWFIKYSDPEINSKVIKHVDKIMKIYPASLHNDMPNIISWFSDRPCVRTGRWLGTQFPKEITDGIQSDFVIEPIADSTIYPIYYIISKYLQKKAITLESLTDEFFDFVFYNIGNIRIVSSKTNIPEKTLISIKEYFQKWYPIDINFGGKEHRTVHFPVYMKMHTMMFEKRYWPKQIFVNWWTMQDIKNDSKIAKSKGGAGSVTSIINNYSADAIRLYYCHASSPHVDIEWSIDSLIQYQKEIERIRSLITTITNKVDFINLNKEKDDIVQWFAFTIKKSFNCMYNYLEQMEIRKMTQECYYNIPKIIWRFIHRDGSFNKEIKEYIVEWIKYLAIVTPFMAEEIYHALGNNQSIFSTDNIINKHILEKRPSSIEEEIYIDNVIQDIIKIKRVIKHVDTSRVYIYSSNIPFKSNKTEEYVLTSASNYITTKTGSKPIINDNTKLTGQNKKKTVVRKPNIIYF